MRAPLLLLAACLLPSLCFAQLGLGGLAPQAAPAEGPALPDIQVPTDLCRTDFCLAGVPAACGGNCILNPLNNVTEYCALKCISLWDSATVKGCLADKAAGTYIGAKLQKISDFCNAGKIAAARKKATIAQYTKLFPCTAKSNSTVVVGLDSCLTGKNATATNCPAVCASSLLAVPPKCRATFPELSKPWASTLTSCIAGDATAPEAMAAGAEGTIGFTPAPPALALAPVASSDPAAAATSSAHMEVASFGTMLLASVVTVLAMHA